MVDELAEPTPEPAIPQRVLKAGSRAQVSEVRNNLLAFQSRVAFRSALAELFKVGIEDAIKVLRALSEDFADRPGLDVKAELLKRVGNAEAIREIAHSC